MRGWVAASLAAGALVLTACGGSRSDPNLITQSSIGPLRLGEPRSLVDAALGRGTVVRHRVQPYGDLAGWTVTRVRYPRQHLGVSYATKPGGMPVAVLLATASSMYVTDDGGRVGDSVEHLRGLFNMHCAFGACFDGPPLRGVGFMIDHGRASAIEVVPGSGYPIVIWEADA